MKFVAALLCLLALPAHAQEMTWEEWEKSVPKMTEQERKAFNTAAAKMYDTKCRCLVFIYRDKISELPAEMSNASRWWLIRKIQSGEAIPLDISKERGS